MTASTTEVDTPQSLHAAVSIQSRFTTSFGDELCPDEESSVISWVPLLRGIALPAQRLAASLADHSHWRSLSSCREYCYALEDRADLLYQCIGLLSDRSRRPNLRFNRTEGHLRQIDKLDSRLNEIATVSLRAHANGKPCTYEGSLQSAYDEILSFAHAAGVRITLRQHRLENARGAGHDWLEFFKQMCMASREIVQSHRALKELRSKWSKLKTSGIPEFPITVLDDHQSATDCVATLDRPSTGTEVFDKITESIEKRRTEFTEELRRRRSAESTAY